jgi:predicted RNA-binding protein
VGRVDSQLVWKQDDVVQVLTAQGFRLVRDEMVYRLRKRVRAATAAGMRRVVRTEEQRKDDTHLTGKAVLDFHKYIITEYEPPPDKDMLAIFQCSVSRPFSKSPSHGSMRKAVRLATGKDPKADFEDCRCHVVVLSSVIGPVPYELETTYPADERGGGVKQMSPQDYHLARPLLAERMAAYLRRWHNRYKVITTFTHGRYGEVMRMARDLAGLHFSVLPDPSGPRLRGGNQYWTRDWIQVFFELLEAMTEEERAEAMARLAAEGVKVDAR